MPAFAVHGTDEADDSDSAKHEGEVLAEVGDEVGDHEVKRDGCALDGMPVDEVVTPVTIPDDESDEWHIGDGGELACVKRDRGGGEHEGVRASSNFQFLNFFYTIFSDMDWHC